MSADVVWEPIAPGRSGASLARPLVAVSALELRGVSWKHTTGAEAGRYLGAFERLLRVVVLGLGGVIALDMVTDADELRIRLLAGCPADRPGESPWSPSAQLERFRLDVARAFAFQPMDVALHLDALRTLSEALVLDPALVRASHDGTVATAALPLEFSPAGRGGLAQILDLGLGQACCVRTVVAPPLRPRPEPDALITQLANADALTRAPEVPYAVTYRARGVRRALQRALDCWLGQHCAVEVQVRAKDLTAVSRVTSLVSDELALSKDARAADQMSPPRFRIELADGGVPDLSLPPAMRALGPGDIVAAPVPSFWTNDRGERPKNLATLASAATLVSPPLPAHCDLRSIVDTVVEDRAVTRPDAWRDGSPVGVDSGENPISLDDEVIGSHVHVMGVSGSGKTTVMRRMILGDLAADRGIVVLDPHSDLARRVISSAGFTEDGVAGDAPFPGLRVLSDGSCGYTAVRQDIGVLIETIEATLPPDYTGPVFRQAARALLTLHAYVGLGRPLAEVSDYVEDPAMLDAALAEFTGPEEVRRYFTMQKLRKESDRAEIDQWVISKFTDYLQTHAAEVLFAPVGEGTTATEMARDRRKLVVDFGALQSSIQDTGFLGQLFLAVLLRDLVAGGPDLRRRFIVYLDEVQLFFGPSVERALQEGRKYGLSLVAAHQTSTQLSRQRFDSLVGQVGLELLFRSSLRDAELLAERLKIDVDSLTAMPDLQCWVTGTVPQRRGGPFLMRTSL